MNSFSSRNVDIDSMMDELNRVQSENNVKTTMRLATFNPDTSERINVYRRKQYEKSPEGREFLERMTERKDDTKKFETMSNIERGVFVYDARDLVDETTDVPYVCEWCTRTGPEGSYRPDICDVCDECEKCHDFKHNACDGCEYNIVRHGVTYGEINGYTENIELSIEEQTLMDEIFRDDDTEVKTPKNTKERFTIMDF